MKNFPIEQIRKRRYEKTLQTLVSLDNLLEQVFQPINRIVYEAAVLLRSIQRSSNPFEINDCIGMLIRLRSKSKSAINDVIQSDGFGSAVTVVSCFFGLGNASKLDWPSNISEDDMMEAAKKLGPYIVVDNLSRVGLMSEFLEELKLANVESLSYRDLLDKINDPEWLASIEDPTTRRMLPDWPEELCEMFAFSYLAHSCAVVSCKLHLNPILCSTHLELTALSKSKEWIAGLDQCIDAIQYADFWSHLFSDSSPPQDESCAALVTGRELEDLFHKEPGTARKWKSRGIIKPVDRKGPRNSHRYDLEVAERSIEAYIGKKNHAVSVTTP